MTRKVDGLRLRINRRFFGVVMVEIKETGFCGHFWCLVSNSPGRGGGTHEGVRYVSPNWVESSAPRKQQPPKLIMTRFAFGDNYVVFFLCALPSDLGIIGLPVQ